MELHHLRYLRSVVRTGSMTAAAEAEFVAQPSVSKQLRQLERELGVALVDRTVHGVKLTSSGDAYLDCCRPLLNDLNAAETALARSAVRPSGTLAVAAHPQLAHHLLLPALPEIYLTASICLLLLVDVFFGKGIPIRVPDEEAGDARLLAADLLREMVGDSRP